MRAIDTVLFDLDDTLHDDTAAYRAAARSVAETVARDRGIDAQALADAYERAAMAFWSALTAEHLTRAIGDERERMWHEALCAVGLDDRALALHCADGYVRARADVLELSPGALDVLVALRERGCKLGLVTNGFAATHHDKIDRLGLRERMDAFFIADEVGMIKPDPELYRHACRVLGCEPARTAMVGDRYGARRPRRARGRPFHRVDRRPRGPAPRGRSATGCRDLLDPRGPARASAARLLAGRPEPAPYQLRARPTSEPNDPPDPRRTGSAGRSLGTPSPCR